MVIDNKKAIEILTNIKKICSCNKCLTCPLSDGRCDKVLGDEVPFEWEIRLGIPLDTDKF